MRRRSMPGVPHFAACNREGHRRTVKIVIALLGVLVLALQYPLWMGSGSLVDTWKLRQERDVQQAENHMLMERNQALEAEVNDLKQGLAAIEERARSELGMTKKDETFYQVIHE